MTDVITDANGDELEHGAPDFPGQFPLGRDWMVKTMTDNARLGSPQDEREAIARDRTWASNYVARRAAALRSEDYADAIRDAIETEWYNGNISETLRDRILRAGDSLLPTADDVRGIFATEHVESVRPAAQLADLVADMRAAWEAYDRDGSRAIDEAIEALERYAEANP